MKNEFDVLLISANQWILPSKPRYYKKLTQFPLGLGYLSAMLEKSGITSQVLDLNVEELGDTQLKEYLLERNPAIIGISSMSGNFANAKRIARIVRSVFEKIPVVYGGIHASLVNQEILNACPEIDYVLTGEAEQSFSELVVNLLSGKSIAEVPGLYFRESNKILKGPKAIYPDNFESLPLPNYSASFTPIEKYQRNFDAKKKIMTMLSTRGCPHRCPYCSTTEFHGRAYRLRPMNSLMEEIDYLIRVYGVEEIYFIDDSFAAHQSRLEDFCRTIKMKYPKLTWGCSCHLSDLLRKDNLKTMTDAGCKKIFVGVETLSEHLQDQIHKRIDLQGLANIIEYSYEHKVCLTLAFMIGFPNETKADRKKIIDFVQEHKKKVSDWRFSPLIVYPGTAFWVNHEKYGIDLSNIDILEPVGLSKSYLRTTPWIDLLKDLVTLCQYSLEGRIKNGEFYRLAVPAMNLS